MALRGRKPIAPELRKQKVNLAYTSVETWAYDELIHEARRTNGSLTQQVAASIQHYAGRLKASRLKRGE